MRQAVDDRRVPGVIAAAGRAGEGSFVIALGDAATEPKTPMQTDTVVRIASMTKLVTSIAVMQLVDQGLVDLEAPLREYVPGFNQPEVLLQFNATTNAFFTRPAARDATLRELLSHTAGYGYFWLHEPLRIASGSKPNLLDPPFLIAEPGSAFAYSTSADVIGQLFEPVTGMGLDDYFEQKIFAPLGMADTGFKRPRDLARLAHVHRRAGEGFRQLPLEKHDHEVRGGGGLYSTAPDYLQLLRCLLRGGELDGIRLLSAASIAEITRNQIGDFAAAMQRTAISDRSNDFIFMDGSQKFGFGVMIETVPRPGRRSVGSYSWGGIVNTFFWVDPAADLAAVLMLQIAPFASRACIELWGQFELALYDDMQKGKI